MHIARFLLCLAGIVCFASVPEASAGTIRFPAADPTFLFELSEEWAEQPRPAGASATTYLSRDGQASVLVHTPPKNYTLQEAMTELPAIVRRLSGWSGVELEIKPPHLAPAGEALHHLPYVWMVASSNRNDLRMIYSYILFTTPAGRTFVIEQVVPAMWFKEHREEFWNLLKSVGPAD